MKFNEKSKSNPEATINAALKELGAINFREEA